MRLLSLLTIGCLLLISSICYALCSFGPDPFPISDNELIKACQLGEIERVRSLIKAGADINVKDKNGIFPLLGAAFSGKPEVAKVLIEAGALLNQVDRNGNTPLMIASLCHESLREREDVALLLVKAGAEISMNGTYRQQNAFMDAARCGSDYLLKAILDSGENINERDIGGGTALIYATAAGKFETVKSLINWGADVNAVDNNGSTALMYAASYRPMMPDPESSTNIEIIKLLIQKGADRSIRNKQKQTAWNIAVNAGNFDVLEMLDQ